MVGVASLVGGMLPLWDATLKVTQLRTSPFTMSPPFFTGLIELTILCAFLAI